MCGQKMGPWGMCRGQSEDGQGGLRAASPLLPSAPQCTRRGRTPSEASSLRPTRFSGLEASSVLGPL